MSTLNTPWRKPPSGRGLISDQLNQERTRQLFGDTLVLHYTVQSSNTNAVVSDDDRDSQSKSTDPRLSAQSTTFSSSEQSRSMEATFTSEQSQSIQPTFTSEQSQSMQETLTSEQSQSIQATFTDGTSQSETDGTSNYSQSMEEVPTATSTHMNFIMSQDSSTEQSTTERERPKLDGNLYIVRSEGPMISSSSSSSYTELYEEPSHDTKSNPGKALPQMIAVQSMSSAIVSSATFDRDDFLLEAIDVVPQLRPLVESCSSSDGQATIEDRRREQQLHECYLLEETDSEALLQPPSTMDSGIDASTKSRGSSRLTDTVERASLNATPSIDLVFSNLTEHREETMSIPITPFSNIPYVHASYASAAPMMLEDKRWMKILRQVMPEAHADAIEVLKQTVPPARTSAKMAKIMKWAENNPVVAAYGLMNSNCGKDAGSQLLEALPTPTETDVELSRFTFARRERRHQTLGASAMPIARKRSQNFQRPRTRPTLEWDVFLDPAIVKAVDRALQQVDQLDTSEDWTASQMEVDRHISRLINRMILAHGTPSQLVSEAIGMAPEYNFSSIVEQAESQRLYRRKDRMKTWEGSGMHQALAKSVHPRPISPVNGEVAVTVPGKSTVAASGIFLERWLRMFARALQLDRGGQVLIDAPSVIVDGDDYNMEMQQMKQPFCGMFLCLGYGDVNSKQTDHTMGTMARSAKEIEGLLGSQLRVVLDLKSRRVPPRVWARLIGVMRSRGICVEGIGSFEVDELRQINNACAVPVKKIRFFHSAGDLQKACHANEVEFGDNVFFNAGSLFDTNSDSMSFGCCQGPLPDGMTRSMVFHPYAYPRSEVEANFGKIDCHATIEDYKRRFNLQIGLYVQEFSISQFAIESLVQFTNRHSQVYNLGLAWGGINGKTARGLEGDGYWSQRYMGRTWDMQAAPFGNLELLQPVDHHLVQRVALAGAWGHLGTVNLAGSHKAPSMVAGIGACHGQEVL
jgi:hypothetical protein